ncbi:MAG: hypothetical protein FWC43_09020 [Planctomycetaceae bacterium]|nr:hypothetical protein [Planctomycetaceae bacterium]
MKRLVISLLVTLFPVSMLSAQGLCPSGEPSVELAKLWWPEQFNIYTPIGWKDHSFKFTVLYNGMLICEPAHHMNSRTAPWRGQNFLLTFRASADGLPFPLPTTAASTWSRDGGQGVQGWTKGHETPVLWTEYRNQAGVVLKSEVFAHITSNEDVVTSLEPTYAWVRLSVAHVDPFRHPETFSMSVQLTKSPLGIGNYGAATVGIIIYPELIPYPNKLTAEAYTDNNRTGYRITEPDQKVRLIALPAEEGRLSFSEISQGVSNLKVTFNAVEGEYVDLLVPMLPQPREEIDRELALGYDGALAMSDRYWSSKSDTVATIHVPEPFFNEALEQNMKFASVVAERDHNTKEYSYLTGVWGYDALWATPTSMVSHMFIDQMGDFEKTKKYSEIFYKNQGTVKAPGSAYQLHDGYFSTPKTLTSIDWLTDHGAVMYQLATHGLLTGDKEFIDHWTGPLEKACDFIMEYSAATGHGGVEGLLPPAVATDESVPLQAVWNLAWNYKGMLTTVRLFEKIKHPKAAEYREFLKKYKETFVREYRKIAEEGPHWIDSQGRERYKPSTFMSNAPIFSFEPFYLDTGPMVLVWAELMEADDPIMVDVVDFFREGPNWKLWIGDGKLHHAACDRPLLIHEMSTCEPCYSWNVFHSWQLGDRQKFLEGMYSIMVGAISQNTYISCEHRHAIQGTMCAFPLAFYFAKLSVIDDQLSHGDLHLMRLCPHAWISSEEETRFEKMPTEFGPVNLKFRRSADGKTLNVSFTANWREKPNKIILHVPQMPGLEKIIVNGKSYNGVKEIDLGF